MEQVVNLLKKFNSDAKKIDPRTVPQPRKLPTDREEVWIKAASLAIGYIRAARAEYDLHTNKAPAFITAAISLMKEMLGLGRRNFSILERYRYQDDLDKMLRRLHVSGCDERCLDDVQQLFEILVNRTPTRKPFTPMSPKGWVEVKKTPAEGVPKENSANTFSFVVPDTTYLKIKEKLGLMFGPYLDDRVKTEYWKTGGGKGMQTVRVSAVKPEEEKKLLEIISG
jgi:hypothetical protein